MIVYLDQWTTDCSICQFDFSWRHFVFNQRAEVEESRVKLVITSLQQPLLMLPLITSPSRLLISRQILRQDQFKEEKKLGGSSFPAPLSFIWYSGEWIGLGHTQMLHHHLPLTVGSFHLFRFSTFEMSTLILWMPVSNPNVTRVASEPQLTRQERRSDFSFHQSPPNSEEHLLVKSSEKDAKTLTPPKTIVGIVIFVTTFPFPISLKPKDHFHFIWLKPVSALSCPSVSRLVEFCSICWICQSC